MFHVGIYPYYVCVLFTTPVFPLYNLSSGNLQRHASYKRFLPTEPPIKQKAWPLPIF